MQSWLLPYGWLLVSLGWSGIVHSLTSLQMEKFCSSPGYVGIIGGPHNRLVTEGGRLSLVCCLPGRNKGQDHEQLVWINPHGMTLPNHFSEPYSRTVHQIYYLPDFRLSGYLVTTLVIKNFTVQDSGSYTCQKSNSNPSIATVAVRIDARPRLLADYLPIPPAEHDDPSSAVVAGQPVFVPLEEGRHGEIWCRINPNIQSDRVHLTWYFQGRQLIAPASAMIGYRMRSPYEQMYLQQPEKVRIGAEEDLESLANEHRFMGNSPSYGRMNGQPLSIDPAEFGIQIHNQGQLLQNDRISNKHSGVYLCKAEAENPAWSLEAAQYDPPSYESGAIEAQVIVQLQAIRGIVFTPPRMLPGSPIEVVTPGAIRHHQPTLPPQDYVYKKRTKRSTGDVSIMRRPPFRYNVTDSVFQQNGNLQQLYPADNHIFPSNPKVVAMEGGQLVMECQARGKPNPKLLWYRGGMGSVMLTDTRAVTFDQRIKEALQNLPIDEVQRQMGIFIVDSGHLLPEILGSDRDSVKSDNYYEPTTTASIEGKHVRASKLGRFELSVWVREDDQGDPVITVSRLTINHIKPADATRYTCMALLNLADYGGVGNYTDVGSIFPEIILHPRFIKSGTKLRVDANPGENATFTCEAYGGLSNPRGLRVRFIRGEGVPELVRIASNGQQLTRGSQVKDASFGLSSIPESSNMLHQRNIIRRTDSSSKFIATPYGNFASNKSVEIIDRTTNPRYRISQMSDPMNPYMSILTLHIVDLRPEDNGYYACEALSGPTWRTITPTSHEHIGRLNVWFAPPQVETREISKITKSGNVIENQGVVYGLPHTPSRLSCQSRGQPPPTWEWIIPQTGSSVSVDGSSNLLGFQRYDYLDGETSISELYVPAGFRDVGVFGTYICTASNRLGSATGHVRLKMATHPDRPNMTACKVEATMIELCVSPPEETGGLPLTHYELRIQTHPRGGFYGPFAYLPGRRLLRLPHLIPGFVYRIALSAVSAAGRGPNAYLQVSTNELTKPKLELLKDPTYIEDKAYTLHWNANNLNEATQVDYTIKIRPVELEYTSGGVSGKPLAQWLVHYNINPKCAKSALEMNKHLLCEYRVSGLEPGTPYELELSHRTKQGLLDEQRILFKTSSLSGAAGSVLTLPSYLRQQPGNSTNSVTRVNLNILSILVLELAFRLFR